MHFDNPNPIIKANNAAKTAALTRFMNALSWIFFKRLSLALFQKATGTGWSSSSSFPFPGSAPPAGGTGGIIGGTIGVSTGTNPCSTGARAVGSSSFSGSCSTFDSEDGVGTGFATAGSTTGSGSNSSLRADGPNGITVGFSSSLDAPFAFFSFLVGAGSSFLTDFFKLSIKLSNVSS